MPVVIYEREIISFDDFTVGDVPLGLPDRVIVGPYYTFRYEAYDELEILIERLSQILNEKCEHLFVFLSCKVI